jgi:Trk-type K+ transport system membrane component
MDVNKRPLSVTVISVVFIAAGAIGFIYHLTDFEAQHSASPELVWISLVRLVAVVCGAYMLTGKNWARWVALVWMAYHVILSAFHSWFELAVHAAIFAVVAYVLLRRDAARYFRVSTARRFAS